MLRLYETLKLRCLSTTLPDSLADVEIETPGESAGQRYAQHFSTVLLTS